MARQSEAAKIRRRNVPNRRGAFDTWGDATWDALLIRPRPGTNEDGAAALPDLAEPDPAEALAACDGVGALERDVTAAVLDGSWVPPVGEWALLVVPRTTGWATLVSTGRTEELLESRLADFCGETLRTGASDAAGLLTLRRRRHSGPGGTPEALVEFRTDGVLWDEADEDEPLEDEPLEDEPLEDEPLEDEPLEDEPLEDEPLDEGTDDGVSIAVQFGPPPGAAEIAAWDRLAEALEGTHLTGSAFSPDIAAAWLEARTSVEDAHQTLLREADAYIPGLAFQRDGGVGNSGRLCAAHGHEDFLAPEHVARIDVVRFGKVRKTPAAEAAGRRLEAAVGRGDARAVVRALRAGATVGVLPASRHTALWLALNAAGQFGAKNRSALPEIVQALLQTGADPNERPRDAASAVELLLTLEFVQSQDRSKRGVANRCDALALLGRLIDGGCDVNALSYGQNMHGHRPLHAAASQNRPAFVRVLLDRGADPRLTDDRGLAPRAGLLNQLESNAARTWAPNCVPLERALAEHTETLALLDAAGAN